MKKVNLTEFRNRLSKYIHEVTKGAEIGITLRNRVVALVVPPIEDTKKEAKQFLKRLQKSCVIKDVVSLIGE